jgi:flagellum-specific ATP synthase
VSGLTVVAEGLPLPMGALCEIQTASSGNLAAQVVSFKGNRTVLMPLRDLQGISVHDRVVSRSGLESVPVGRRMVGAVLNGLGRPIGGTTDFPIEEQYPVFCAAPAALSRREITDPLATGVRTIDAMHTLGGGQRMGVFAGTGVGKSVLMGMIARYTSADVTVVALIGERGREVGDFLRNDLGEEGRKRCVLVVSTSDESPVLRVRAAFVATAVAEFFRDQGKDVLLMMDSTTRMATAQRQIGLAAGEPPTTKGFPPSVFSMLPQLLERSGKTKRGSITGLYTVLVEGDDLTEPIADATRGILDGHIWLSRDLANRGHYPAISVNESISRVMTSVVPSEHERAALELRKVLASWHDVEDLVNVGAYVPGANVEFDIAVRMKPAIDLFLQQRVQEKADFVKTREILIELARQIGVLREQLKAGATGVRKGS